MYRTSFAVRRAFAERIALALLAMAVAPAVTEAQVTLSTPDTAATQRHKHLFNHRDVVIMAAMTATTFALFPLDKRFANELQDPSTQANKFFKTSSKGVEYIASPGAYYIGGSLYLVGRVAKMPRVADLGWHGTEAVLVGEGISYVLKGVMGRSRPFVSADTIPRDFDWGRGFKDPNWRSFPSGHSTTAFAGAAAITDETTLWWPKSTWIVGPLMYGGATLVGLSRMYHNKHWASDVALGALIGTFSGKKVVMASHDNPHNIFDRIMLGTHVASADRGRVKFGWVVPVDDKLRLDPAERKASH
jgi:membrane-associated phospholipid phosphatase